MKKFTTALALSCLLSTPSFSKEKQFQYTKTTGTYITKGLLVTGLGFLSTGVILDKLNRSPMAGFAYGMMGVIIIEVGIFTFLGVASTTGTKKIDTKKYKHEYKKMKILSKSVLGSNILPQSKDFSFIINNLNCNNCSSDLEIVQTFSNIFIKLDKLAKESVKNKVFNPKKPEEIFSNDDMLNKIEATLDNNNDNNNREIAKTIFAMALVNHSF